MEFYSGKSGQTGRFSAGVCRRLVHLSVGTGVSLERLREMNAAAMMRRVNAHVQGWLLSESGREALEKLRAALSRVA